MMWQLRPKPKAEVEANPEIFFWLLRVDVCTWKRHMRDLGWMPWGDHYEYKFTTRPTAEDVLRLADLHPHVKEMVETFGIPVFTDKQECRCVNVQVGEIKLTRMPVIENRKED
jgi:hypothetical protein